MLDKKVIAAIRLLEWLRFNEVAIDVLHCVRIVVVVVFLIIGLLLGNVRYYVTGRY